VVKFLQGSVKNFFRIDSQKCDVLILDAVGSEHIKECIPSRSSNVVLPVRGIVPWIFSVEFVYRLVYRLIQRHSLGTSVLFSIIDTLKPKVVITFIDNNYLIGKIHNFFHGKLLISFQNGIRGGRYGGWNQKINFSILYGFGDYERDYILQRDINFLEYNPIGSLKYGIYCDKFRHQKKNDKYDVVLISQYTSSELLMGELSRKHMKKLYKCIASICSNNNLSFAVALRYETKNNQINSEIDFFQSVGCTEAIKLIPNNYNTFDSYNAVSSARVAISHSSTLAFECFGGGTKMMFSALMQNDYLCKELGMHGSFEQMPKEVLLYSFKSGHIDDKLMKLLGMKHEEYMEVTHSARSYYMKFSEVYPHKVVMRKIEDYLSG
jgi:surface carbohydrate biosynthesis protein